MASIARSRYALCLKLACLDKLGPGYAALLSSSPGNFLLVFSNDNMAVELNVVQVSQLKTAHPADHVSARVPTTNGSFFSSIGLTLWVQDMWTSESWKRNLPLSPQVLDIAR